MSDRFTLKQKLRRRRLLRRILLLFAVLAVVGAAVWTVFFSSVLAVERVVISGLERLPEDEIVRLAAVPAGEPLAMVDADAISGRISENIQVEDAEVVRAWPRTIEITVTERQPVAWIDRDGQSWEVDRNGVVFYPTDQPGEAYPQLVLDSDDLPTLAAAAQVAADLGELDSQLLTSVVAIGATTRDSVDVQLTLDRNIVWGSADQPEEKLAALTALLGLETDFAVYDVSAPTRPTTKAVESETPSAEEPVQ